MSLPCSLWQINIFTSLHKHNKGDKYIYIVLGYHYNYRSLENGLKIKVDQLFTHIYSKTFPNPFIQNIFNIFSVIIKQIEAYFCARDLLFPGGPNLGSVRMRDSLNI